MVFAILQNEFDEGHLNWINACKKFKVDCQVIKLTSAHWLEMINSGNFDGFLACPSGREDVFKRMYDERVYIIDKVLGKFVYPSYDEISIHENKKFLSYWLFANKIPHPKTIVYYDKKEFLSEYSKIPLPVVGKMNIGASGKGVHVFRDVDSLKKYGEDAFSGGIRQAWGPNMKMGGYGKRIMNVIKNPKYIAKRVQVYKKLYNELQKGYIILQEYVQHDYEWRVVRIGDSFFGHQKVKQGDKASGTKGIDYVYPPDRLLDFVKDLCEKFQFNSMSVDLFEDNKGGYLVNEMQCIFGHVQEYICEKDGKPGRLVKNSGEWIFEEGLFNSNLSYDLRIENALALLKKRLA